LLVAAAAVGLIGCASSSQSHSSRGTTPAGTSRSAGDAGNVADAAPGPLRGTLSRIDKQGGSREAPETTVTVSLENTGPTECTVSLYKLDMQLGAMASAKALCPVNNLKLAPGSKGDTQCQVKGATQAGDAPGLSVGHTPVVDIVASCK